jgi:hypothetical protein
MVSAIALGALSSPDLRDVMKKPVWWQKHHFCIRMHINELFSQMTTHYLRYGAFQVPGFPLTGSTQHHEQSNSLFSP